MTAGRWRRSSSVVRTSTSIATRGRGRSPRRSPRHRRSSSTAVWASRRGRRCGRRRRRLGAASLPSVAAGCCRRPSHSLHRRRSHTPHLARRSRPRRLCVRCRGCPLVSIAERTLRIGAAIGRKTRRSGAASMRSAAARSRHLICQRLLRRRLRPSIAAPSSRIGRQPGPSPRRRGVASTQARVATTAGLAWRNLTIARRGFSSGTRPGRQQRRHGAATTRAKVARRSLAPRRSDLAPRTSFSRRHRRCRPAAAASSPSSSVVWLRGCAGALRSWHGPKHAGSE
mmetsp:Transcript_88227/g.224629  ORF Transcript_88227/g.224629 Transcript_88227/m.224629 type:complete len:284 (+) Transcript_88227:406-1257(+)